MVQSCLKLSMRLKSASTVASIVLLCTFLSGCKTGAAPSTGFTEPKMMSNDPSLPFHKVWRKPGTDFSTYKKIYVASINTDYMLEQTEWQKGMRQEEIRRDVEQLATYTRDALRTAFRNDPDRRFVVLAGPSQDPDVLRFEFAIVEVVPSKVVLNALGYVPFGIGLTVNAVRMVAQDRSTIAFEARGRDASTGEIVFMAADREAQQTTVVDLRGLTWYSHAYGIIDDWAKQFVQIANRHPGATVEDTSAFRLQPW
jgi:hypothetical protein